MPSNDRLVSNYSSGVSTPAIASDTTAKAVNTARIAWMIQNLGQNPLFVKRGTGASTTVFDVVLKAGTANDDGTGGIYIEGAGLGWTGIITIAGTSPRYVITEVAP